MRTVARGRRAPSLAGKPLPLRRNVRPRVGAGRDGKLDRAVERRHAHLAAEHRLVERDRQIEPQIGAVALEQRMRRDRDGDQQIAGRAAGPGSPWPLQPDLLAVGEAGRNLDLDLLAGRQPHALRRAVRGLRQRDGQRRR